MTKPQATWWQAGKGVVESVTGVFTGSSKVIGWVSTPFVAIGKWGVQATKNSLAKPGLGKGLVVIAVAVYAAYKFFGGGKSEPEAETASLSPAALSAARQRAFQAGMTEGLEQEGETNRWQSFVAAQRQGVAQTTSLPPR